MRFFTPSTLDLHKMLTERNETYWIRHEWKLNYIITVLYLHRWNKASQIDEFVPLNFSVLSKTLGRRHTLPAKKKLLELGIIETDNHYIVDEKSIGYRFSENYQDVRFIEVKLDPSCKTAFNRILGSLSVSLTQPEHEFVFRTLEQVTLDAGVSLFLSQFKPESVAQADYYERSVEFINRQEWFFTSSQKTGRVFNNLPRSPL